MTAEYLVLQKRYPHTHTYTLTLTLTITLILMVTFTLTFAIERARSAHLSHTVGCQGIPTHAAVEVVPTHATVEVLNNSAH